MLFGRLRQFCHSFISVLIVSVLLPSVTVMASPKAHFSAVDASVVPVSFGAGRQPDPKLYRMALKAYQKARAQGLAKKPVIAIVDYSKPSSQKRLWVVDLAHHRVPLVTYVAHGKGSGKLNATHFSNQTGSHASSMGVFVTDHTYVGHHGLSLRLRGLDRGFNNHALSRAIVIHGAKYVSPSFIHRHGRLGLSWGCLAVSSKMAKPVIRLLKDGALVFAYYPNANWMAHSSYL